MSVETSIIIRTKNEGKTIEHTLRMIEYQTYQDWEIIVVDSVSKDNTLEIAGQHGCHIIQIERYFAGLALNLGIEKAQGTIIVILTCHAPPANEQWLEILVSTLKEKYAEDSQVAGVWGRAIAHPDANPIEKFSRLNYYRQDGRHFGCVNSAILREVWKNHHFNESLIAAEDRFWAEELQMKGYNFVYIPEAIVYHSHPFSFRSIYDFSWRTGWSDTLYNYSSTNLYLNPLYFIRRLLSVTLRINWFIIKNEPRKIAWIFIVPIYQLISLLGRIMGILQVRWKLRKV